MSKKDYEMLARVFANGRAAYTSTVAKAVIADVARAMASELLNTNPRFNMNRFLAACGIPT